MMHKRIMERDSIQLQNLRPTESPDCVIENTTEICFANSDLSEYREIYPDLQLSKEQAVSRSLQFTILQKERGKKKSFMRRTLQNIDIWSYMHTIIATDYGKDACLYFKLSRWLTFHVALVALTCVVFLVFPMAILGANTSADYSAVLFSNYDNWLENTAVFYGYYNQTQRSNGTVVYSISRAYFWINILTRTVYLVLIIRKLIYTVSVVYTERYSSVVLKSTVGIQYILGMWDFRAVTNRGARFCKDNIKQFVKKLNSSTRMSKKVTTSLNVLINGIGLLLMAVAFERFTWLITDDENFFQRSQPNTIPILEYIRSPVAASLIVISMTWVFDLVKCIEIYEKDYWKVIISTGRIITLNCGMSIILIYHWSTMISCTNPGTALRNITTCGLIRDRITISGGSLIYKCWETWLGQRILVYILVNIALSFIFYLCLDVIKSIIMCTDSSFIKPKFFYLGYLGNMSYMDCLFWVGYYYCPILSVLWLVAILCFFFYNINMISISCLPRGSSSQTAGLQNALFILMYLLSSLIGICTLVSHSLLFKPSRQCGPFTHLEYNYSFDDFQPSKYFAGNKFLKTVIDIGDQLLFSDGLWYAVIIVLLSLAFKSTFQVNALRKICRLAVTDNKMIENDRKIASEGCMVAMERLRLNRRNYQPARSEENDKTLSDIFDNFVL